MNSFTIEGNLVNIPGRKISWASVTVTDGIISAITHAGEPRPNSSFILPGFVDSHVHVESSMLVPSEFARLAVVHGTVGTISDPHEIANVCGMPGVEFMINNGKTVPFKFYFGAPSCVPATVFETAGAALDARSVEELLGRNDVSYLSEMMNFPGVLNKDPEVMAKIASAKKFNKPVDGHAPGLRGDAAKNYIDAGISTDHECFTAEEALEKLSYGMKILIREGSAAKNFEALVDLLHEHSANMMLCSDDKHPDSLVDGHINQLCARAIKKGIDLYKVLQVACINPVVHYKMKIGLLREGDPADFIVCNDLENFKVERTYIDGKLVAENGQTLISAETSAVLNNFECSPKIPGDFQFHDNDEQTISVIEALDGQLITNRLELVPNREAGFVVSDTGNDVLKIVVVNRYQDKPIAKSFIRNFGLQGGAIASSVAHDSHNIVAVGVDDESICRAVNLVITQRGGVSAVLGEEEKILALPVAGLMSNSDGYKVAEEYTAIDKFVKDKLGSGLGSPFMTLSFMALLVIPHLKLSDKGLFDGDKFEFLYTND